jgi:hypothetical protein
LHAGAHAFGQFGRHVRLAAHRRRLEGQVPPFFLPDLRIAHFQQDAVARLQFVGVVEDGFRVRDVAIGEVILDRLRVQFARQFRVRHDGLQFGTEDEIAGRQQRIKHRLDADMVARQEHGLLVAVPDAEGEHAAQAVHAIGAPRFPRVQHHFRIGLGAERITHAFQLGHQFAVVIGFAVVDDHHAAVRVEQRLLAGGQVDHGQAAVAHAQRFFQVQLALVRAPVVLAFIHAVQRGAVDLALARGIKNSDNSAHGAIPVAF